MMSRIVVDAGATKTEFVVLCEGVVSFRYVGCGMNPNYSTEADMLQVFADFVSQWRDSSSVEALFYYGAGCASVANQQRLQQLIGRFFPFAMVAVYSDLLAVCHALSRNNQSLVGIIGTGAASCLYNGNEMVMRAPSLGYMLGDDGSGTNLGKRLLTLFLNNQLPQTLHQQLALEYHISFENVIHRVYQEPAPNAFMASFAPFVHQHLDEPVIYQLALNAFSDFFDKQKGHYPDTESLPWNLSGSVAYHFKSVIQKAAALQHCRCDKIVASPMDLLLEYYK